MDPPVFWEEAAPSADPHFPYRVDLYRPNAVRNETFHTHPKCKRGNGLTPSLTLRVSVPRGHVQYSLGANRCRAWTGTDREFSASFDHQASATTISFSFLDLSPPKANKTVSFFVSFHRGATKSGILFLVSIARALARRFYRCRPWLSDVSPLDIAGVWGWEATRIGGWMTEILSSTWLSDSRCLSLARPAPLRWSRRPAPSCSSRKRRSCGDPRR